VTPESIAALPLRALEKSTKNIVIELACGKRFRIVGGKNRRPLEKGAAGFTPREMIAILNNGLSEEDFLSLIQMKEMGLADSIVEITQPQSSDGTPAQGSPA